MESSFDTNSIDIMSVLDSLENVKDLYPNLIPTKLLASQIASLDNEDDVNFKKSLNNTTQIVWGNKGSKILILGSFDDIKFKEDDTFWNTILKNGMKLDKNDVYCISLGCDNNIINYKDFSFILCLGNSAREILNNALGACMECSKVCEVDDLKIMVTRTISESFSNSNVKRIFWEDLQKFLKEIR